MSNNSQCVNDFNKVGLRCPVGECHQENQKKCVIYNLYFPPLDPPGPGGFGQKFSEINEKLSSVSDSLDSFRKELSLRVTKVEEKHSEDIRRLADIVAELRHLIEDLQHRRQKRRQQQMYR